VKSPYFKAISLFIAVNLLLISSVWMSAAQPSNTLTGILGVEFQDAQGFSGESNARYFIADGSGRNVELDITPEVLSAAGGYFAVYGKTVQVTLSGVSGRNGGALVSALTPLSDTRWFTIDPQGAEHWDNLLCKFNGNTTTPSTRDFIVAMMDDVTVGMGDFWADMGRGGSSFTHTTTEWKTMPAGISNGSSLDSILNACLTLHGINPNGSYQVNTFYNDALQGAAVGGSDFSTPGIERRYTWMPDWSYDWGYPTLAHEMGHAYGMPHSNNSDGDTSPYDNPWDVMGGPAPFTEWYWDGTNNFVIGKPMNNYYANQLGFIQNSDVYTYSGFGTQEVIIDHVGLSSTDNYFNAYIPTTGNKLFSLETRMQSKGGYQSGFWDEKGTGTQVDDVSLNGVVIYSIDPARSEPAWQAMATSDAITYGEDAILQVGETFTSAANNLSITVLEQTAEGFRVSITKTEPFGQISPAKNATVQAVFPTFEWRVVETATQYTLTMVSKTEGVILNYNMTVAAVEACTTTCTFTPSDAAWKVKTGATYKWSVKAKDAASAVLASSPKWFIYFQALPQTIVINAPDANGTVSGQTQFSWNDDFRVESWQLVLKNNAGIIKFKQTYLDGDICDGTTCTATVDLTAFKKGAYTWRVTAKHTNVLGKKNSVWRAVKIQPVVAPPTVSAETDSFRAP